MPISFACESTSKEIDNCTTDEDFSDKLTQEVYEASDLIAGSFSSTLTDEQLLFIRRVSQRLVIFLFFCFRSLIEVQVTLSCGCVCVCSM